MIGNYDSCCYKLEGLREEILGLLTQQQQHSQPKKGLGACQMIGEGYVFLRDGEEGKRKELREWWDIP